MTRRRVISALLIVVCAVAIAAGAFVYGSRHRFSSVCSLYFMNSAGTSLDVEERKIGYAQESDLPWKVIEELIKGPDSNKNVRVINRNTALISITDDGYGNLVVDFTKEFIVEDSAKAVFPVYAVVKSLCSLEGVTSVKVTVEGNDFTTSDGTVIGTLTSDDINLSIDTYTSETQTVKVYFADIATRKLSAEERTVKITDQQPIEQYIIEEIIKGPQSETNTGVLSKDTTLASVNISNNIGFVNFAKNFVDKNKSSEDSEKLTIYAIVNSMTELESVNRVQFLIDGKIVEKFGDIDISEPIGRDETMIE